VEIAVRLVRCVLVVCADVGKAPLRRVWRACRCRVTHGSWSSLRRSSDPCVRRAGPASGRWSGAWAWSRRRYGKCGVPVVVGW